MEKTTTVIRILLGLMMVIFGLNGFLQFMPMPKLSPEMGAFLGALAATGYIFPLIAVIQVGTGILLLINKYTPPGISNFGTGNGQCLFGSSALARYRRYSSGKRNDRISILCLQRNLL